MNKISLVGLTLIGLMLVINMADSSPQLTFSTNWDGGKRSDNSESIEYNDNRILGDFD
jgi:hypothetical protein